MKVKLTNVKVTHKVNIEYGDILLCADGHGINYIMLVESENSSAALNLNTYSIEHETNTLSELYEFISSVYDIQKIIKAYMSELNLQLESE